MSFFTSGIIPPGVTLPYAGTSAPNGWLLCYGQAVSRTTYSGLFAAIGTTYGSGDGSTTFNLPDCRGRMIGGKDNMGGVAANRITAGVSGITGTTLGAVGGSEAMHQHNHSSTGLTNSTSSVTGTTVANNTGLTNVDHTHNYVDNWTQVFAGAYGLVDSTIDIQTGDRNLTTAGSNTNLNHQHSIPSLSVSGTAAAQTISGSVANTGSGGSQNMVPTIIMNTIIKV